ncbi:uncharacterized protein STEHIDRAFT_159191 [Stereum hirsutum FP-91666 SS1]|uniref:uncharacterized protein n=1 Tax=Stereum hirsutum (strain FP-91666) TaxID=721885 RepID=UPI00044495B0|nr:uncharacterized protein STEHIDRAFT_159191 [Stereum hirsutum FP-91666 SS1]EIM84523.1 hypothetical protein STEHIDRAFT_159191 [Stereum hirsutum FP-91666 SS1]
MYAPPKTSFGRAPALCIRAPNALAPDNVFLIVYYGGEEHIESIYARTPRHAPVVSTKTSRGIRGLRWAGTGLVGSCKEEKKSLHTYSNSSPTVSKTSS